MPHYRNGQPARVGDLVFGQGYNVPRPIAGLVTEFNEAETCNLQVAYVDPIFLARPNSPPRIAPPDVQASYVDAEGKQWGVRIGIEYGEARNFMPLHGDDLFAFIRSETWPKGMAEVLVPLSEHVLRTIEGALETAYRRAWRRCFDAMDQESAKERADTQP